MKCAMDKDCAAEATHIGSKGFIYCAAHAVERRATSRERCRRMRAWELSLIESGKPLPSYKPEPRRRELQITKCHVLISGTEASLGCDHEGAQYHVWLNPDRTVREPLYKNSAANYRTRRLSIASRFGAALIAEMLAHMKRDSLFEKALTDHQRAVDKAERTRRSKLPVHLIVGADKDGTLYFVSENGRLTRNIRDAASFTEEECDLQGAIDANIDLVPPNIATAVIVLTLSTGQLDQLKSGDLNPHS